MKEIVYTKKKSDTVLASDEELTNFVSKVREKIGVPFKEDFKKAQEGDEWPKVYFIPAGKTFSEECQISSLQKFVLTGSHSYLTAELVVFPGEEIFESVGGSKLVFVEKTFSGEKIFLTLNNLRLLNINYSREVDNLVSEVKVLFQVSSNLKWTKSL